MPAAIAIPLITGAASATASIVGAKMASGASKDAATAQVGAANHAADVQKQSSDEALAFQKQQAALDEARYEAAQHANYNQYVQKLKGAQALGQTIGFNLPDAPAYVPVTPGSAGTPSAPAAGAKGAPAIDASKGDIGQQISAYFKSQGVPDTETPYWVQKWHEFGSKDPAYFNSRLAQADIFGGGGRATPNGAGSGSAPFATPTVASYLPPAPSVAPLASPQPFQLRSLSAYLRQPQGM